MIDEPETPGLDAVLRVAMQGALSGVRTTMPGRITAYDATKQMASVQPLIREAYVDERGAERYEDLPQIHSVPVMFVGPARARITWPVQVGDLCVIWFSSSSLDAWVLRGTTQTVDPRDARRHDLNDAIAMVGLHSPGAPPTPAPTDAIVVHAGDGVTIKLGGADATENVAWHSALEALAEVFSSWTPAAGDGGAALKTLLSGLLTDGWPQGATKVKAK